jgi:hypothetical protein
MKITQLAAAALCLGATLCGAAHAVNVDINVGVPGVVVVPPPPPVYVAPAPVYVAPAPVYVRPGWYGERYYDGHRYWARHDWEQHERYARDHGDDHYHHDHDQDRAYHNCPPGHAKKGEC